MKKIFFFIVTILFPLILYPQEYQFEITDEFELKDKDLSYIAFRESELYLYDSTENIIYLIDTKGIFLDSLNLNFKANGMDIYMDTLYVQKNVLLNKNSSILRINHQNGEVYDSIIWSTGEDTDYASLLCVGLNYMISYISAGWSSSIVQVDRSGTIINSIIAPGLGAPVDISFISSNKFCLITNAGNNEDGYYYEYEIDNNIINSTNSSEIPVKDPKGVAFVNDSMFYVYSGNENKIYKLTKNKSVSSIDILNDTGKDIIIFPNPTRNSFRIKSDIIINKIEILKTNGEKMDFHRVNDLVYFQRYPKGIYIVVLSTEHNTISKKLIVN